MEYELTPNTHIKHLNGLQEEVDERQMRGRGEVE